MTNAQQSPFVVTQLRPEGDGGRAGGVYQLTASSVSPTRFCGRDENGMPLEETIPTVHWDYFVDPAGNVCKVPLRTSSVLSMDTEAVRYEQMVVTDLLRTGWIPLSKCPFTNEYHFIVGGPLAKPPKGVEDCGGSKDGCNHLKAIIEKRQERTATKARKEVERIEAMKADEISKMREGIVEGVGEVMAKHLAAQDDRKLAKNRLRDGKGEKEED